MTSTPAGVVGFSQCSVNLIILVLSLAVRNKNISVIREKVEVNILITAYKTIVKIPALYVSFYSPTASHPAQG